MLHKFPQPGPNAGLENVALPHLAPRRAFFQTTRLSYVFIAREYIPRMRFFLFALLAAASFAQSSPRVNLVTSDIANFWKAYDASEPGKRSETFTELYFKPATPGLRDFIRLRIETAEKLAADVERYQKFYSTIRPYTLRVETQRAAILKQLDRYAELYPEANFPTVYFVIGRVTSGGTTSDRGLLIGTEVWSLGPGVDASEINPSFVRAMGTMEKLPQIVLHELTHTQVKRAGPNATPVPNLLARCVKEGAADFITELVTSSSINAHSKEWADARRDELFARFKSDLAAKPDDASHWLYNYGTAGDEPADLGYWIGAEICRSHYAQAKDKRAAVREIVTLTNVAQLVRESAYHSLLP